jgi:hypothetical protein
MQKEVYQALYACVDVQQYSMPENILYASVNQKQHYNGFLAMWQSVTARDQAVILQSTTVINEVMRAQCVF